MDPQLLKGSNQKNLSIDPLFRIINDWVGISVYYIYILYYHIKEGGWIHAEYKSTYLDIDRFHLHRIKYCYIIIL